MRNSTSWLTNLSNIAGKVIYFFSSLIYFFLSKKISRTFVAMPLLRFTQNKFVPMKAQSFRQLIGGYVLSFLALLFSLFSSSTAEAQNAPLNCDKYYMLVGELVNNQPSRTDVYQFSSNSAITSCSLPNGGGEGMVVDPTKNIAYIATSGGQGQIRVYDIIAGAFLTPIQFPAGEDLLDVSISTDYKYLYVSTYTGLYKVDIIGGSGTYGSIVASKLRNTFVNSTAADLWGAAVQPSTGNVYVTTNWQGGTSTIEYVNSNLGTATRIVTAPSGFQFRGIVFDASGNLWATLGGSGVDMVKKYSPSGTELASYNFNNYTSATGNTNGDVNPFDLAFGPDGNLYVTTFAGDCVSRLVLSTGKFQTYLGFEAGAQGKSITFVCGNFKCICSSPVINNPDLAISGGNCSGGTVNNNGSVTITNLSNTAVYEANIKEAATFGTSPIFGAASNITKASGATSLTFKNLKPNTTYTVRVWNSVDACFTDKTFTTPSANCCTSCISNNFVTNGDFAGGTTSGWSKDLFSALIDFGVYNDGTNYAILNTNNNPGAYLVYNDVTTGIVGNRTYTLNMDAATHNPPASGVVQVYMEAYNGNTLLGTSSKYTVENDYGTYGRLPIAAINFTTPANTTKIRIVGYANGSALKFDNVRLTACYATPTLATTVTTQPSCGNADGKVTLTTTGGSGDFSYSKDNVNWQSSNVFSGLTGTTSGTSYTFYVKDNLAGTCSASKVVVLTCSCPVWTNGNNVTICSGDKIPTLSFTSSTGYTGYVQWCVFSQPLTAGQNPYDNTTFKVTCLNEEANVTNATSISLSNLTGMPANNTGSPVTYYVYACIKPIDPNCKTTYSTHVITVNPRPTVTVNSPTVCNGADVTLTATNCSGTVKWYGSLTGTAVLFTGSPYVINNVTANATYYATCTTNSCEGARALSTITLAPSPSINVTNATICSGGSATLTATNCTGTLSWSTGANTTAITVSPTTTTTYTATCNLNGCIQSVPATVTVKTGTDCNNNVCLTCNPATVIRYDLNNCQALSGGYTYAEFTPAYPNSANFINITATNIYRENPDVNFHSCTVGASNVSGTDNAMCISANVSTVADWSKAIKFSASLTPSQVGSITSLKFNQKAAATLTYSPSPASSGGTASNNYPTKYAIRVYKAGTLIYEKLDATTSPQNWTTENIDFTADADFTFTSASTYDFQLTAYAPVGNSASISVWDVDNFEVIACNKSNTVTATASNNGPKCQNDPVTLTATGGTSYSWSGPSGFTATGASVTTTIAGTYTVTVTNTVGCTATATTVVVVYPNPTVTVDSKTICSGGTATLTASGCVGSVVWSGAGTGSGTTITVSPSATGTYGYTATCTNSNNCKATATGVVTVTAQPTVSLPIDFQVCSGTPTTLTATGCAGTLSWSTNVGGSTSATVSVTPINTGVSAINITYTVTCTTSTNNGCTATDAVIVTVNPLPTVTLTPTNITCNGAKDGKILATGNGGTPQYTFSINGGAFTTPAAATNTFTGLDPNTTYTITVKDTKGCIATSSATLTQPAVLTVSTTKVDPKCEKSDGSINLSVTGGTTPYTYLWSDGSTTEDLTAKVEGTYSVTVTDKNGCIATTSVALTPQDCSFDLALKKVLKTAGTYKPGDNVTFTISVINQGTVTATNVQVTDYIPTGLTLSDATWTAISGKATLNAVIPTIAPGATVTRDITFKIDANYEGASVVNRAEISAATNARGLLDKDSTPDAVLGNDKGGQVSSPADDYVDGNGTGVVGDGVAATDEDDEDPALLNITQTFDLALRKVRTSDPKVVPGYDVTYEIEVINQGTITATNVQVSDYIPAGMTISPVETNWNVTGSIATLKTPIASIAPYNTSVKRTITLRVNNVATYQGQTLVNRAEISSASNTLSLNDKDSTPDGILGNDKGGQVDSPADNYVDGTGTGVVGDGVAATDEDDEDPASVSVEKFDLALKKTLNSSTQTPIVGG
ncbi:Ig-like domain-containing protein, partial [Emticicia aquatilis]|uniref:Ig-like domain-containing protein n=1 Tax=Emticicia aquatilis TaxID=1537369 RepID=UPI00166783A5